MIISSSRDQHVRFQLPHTSEATVTTPSPSSTGGRVGSGQRPRESTSLTVSGVAEGRGWVWREHRSLRRGGWWSRATPETVGRSRPRSVTNDQAPQPACCPPTRSFSIRPWYPDSAYAFIGSLG